MDDGEFVLNIVSSEGSGADAKHEKPRRGSGGPGAQLQAPAASAAHEAPFAQPGSAPKRRKSNREAYGGALQHSSSPDAPQPRPSHQPTTATHDPDRTVTFEHIASRGARAKPRARSKPPIDAAQARLDGPVGGEDLQAVMAAVHASRIADNALASELASAPAPRDENIEPVTAGRKNGPLQQTAQVEAPAKAGKRKAPPSGGAASACEPAGANLVPGQLAGKQSHRKAPKSGRADVFGTTGATTFAELGLDQALCTHIAAHGFAKPTAVQKEGIPALLRGRDVMMRAPTGTGKTLAYLAPVVHALGTQTPRVSRGEGCHALVITPTRELTLQVYDVAVLLAKRYIWLVPGLLVGGENRHHEKRRLRKGVTVLVATPGRLLDHLAATEAFVTAGLAWLVLDEADRLLDLGFEQTVRAIVGKLDERSDASARQTVLVSATLSDRLAQLAQRLLRDPVPIGLQIQYDAQSGLQLREAAAAHAEAFEMPAGLQQLFMDVPTKLRLPTLLGTIKLCFDRTPRCKLVVFVTTCDSVELHHRVLGHVYAAACGEALVAHPVLKLHGDMAPGDRTGNMAAFHKAESAVLVSTDVAARGLDFPAVTHILQFDPTGEVAEYVQRVGRTARMGRRGVAVLFLAPAERDYVAELGAGGVAIAQQRLFPALAALPQPREVSARARGEADANRRAFQVAMDAAHLCQARVMAGVERDKALRALAADAFRSYVGAYATHPQHLRRIFHVKKLHLGHVAHSFALKEQPRRLGQSAAKQARKQRKEAGQRKGKQKMRKLGHGKHAEYQTADDLV